MTFIPTICSNILTITWFQYATEIYVHSNKIIVNSNCDILFCNSTIDTIQAKIGTIINMGSTMRINIVINPLSILINLARAD